MCVHMSVCSSACIRMRACAECILACAWALARVRVRARRERTSTNFVSRCIRMFVRMYVYMYACMYVGIYVCMHECMYRLPLECACARVRVRECKRAHTRDSSARPLDVHPYVHECMCMYMCIDTCTGAYSEPISACVCVRVSVRVRSGSGGSARAPHV
jgi:hypothetical protein